MENDKLEKIMKINPIISNNKYYKNIKNNPIAKEVKLADLSHNMDLSRLDNISEYDLQRNEKYKKYYDYLTNDKQEEISHDEDGN